MVLDQKPSSQDLAPENPPIFDSISNVLSQLITRLSRKRLFWGVIDVFQLQIVPTLDTCFKELHPEDEKKAAELFILKVLNEYFYYRDWPYKESDPKFMDTDNDADLRTAASLTFYMFESMYPEILSQSEGFHKLNHQYLQQEKNKYLKDVEF